MVRRMLCTSVVALAVLVLCFAIAPVFIAEANATTNKASAKIDWGSVFLTLDPDMQATNDAADKDAELASDTHGDINFGTIIPTTRTESNRGTMVVKKKTIGVTSTGTYYTIYLSTDSETSNSLDLVTTVDGSSTGSTTFNIPAVAGTWESPAALTTTASWGFAVPSTTIASSDSVSTPPTFPVPSLIDDQIYYTSELSSNAYQTYNNTVWAAVPTNGNAQQIYKATTTNPLGFGVYEVGDETKTGDLVNDHFDIYYGVNIDTDIIAGTYENKVIYTALASASSLDSVSTNLAVSKEFGGKNDEVEIVFDLTDSTSSVTPSMVTVAMVPHKDIYDDAGNIYIPSTGDYALAGLDYDSYDKCTITNLTRPDDKSYISLTCLVPDEVEGSEYDFGVKVSGYNYDYVSKSKTTVAGSQSPQIYPAFIYAGLQTKYSTTDPRYDSSASDPNDNLIVKKMQDMTPGVCNLTNAWGKTTFVELEDTIEEKPASGEYARVYNNTLSGSALADTAAESAAIGVGTFRLADTRETVADGGLLIDGTHYKDYLVRRLADGNCWMVQNLDLNLADFTSTKEKRLTSDNTDIADAEWIPDQSLKDAGGYGNTFGLTGILEPGPDVTTAEQAAERTIAYQFQDRLYFGRNLVWGSRYLQGTTDNVTADTSGAIQIRSTGVYVQNNANAAYPRSYNNDYGYTAGTLSVEDQAQCAAQAGKDNCRMNGFIGDANGDNASFPQTVDRLTQDTTWQPELINPETTDESQFTMRGTKYIGDYYNWYAATAETGKWSMSGTAEASGSICPKGWKLPSNTKSAAVGGSWSYLLGNDVYAYSNANSGSQQAAIVKMMQLPLSIPFTGYYHWNNGTIYNRGFGGYFWTSTANSTDANTSARFLFLYYTGDVYPQNYHPKVGGFSIRCVSHGDELNSTASQEVLAAESSCSAGNICYNANGGTGTMSDQSASASASVVLTAPTFVRTGYSFAGWSTQDNGFGTVYGPNETITTPSTLGSTGLQLYAKWLPSSGTMQDFTSTQCDALGIHQSVALTDNRDGNTYTVTKLKDGNCWMTTNLALNLADFAGTHKLNSTNTDIGNNNASNTALAPCTSGDDCYDATENGYYWDPSRSVYDRIEAFESTFDEKGYSKDFTGFSKLFIGQEQPAQFLTDSQKGMIWNSLYRDDGNGNPSTEQVYNDSGNTVLTVNGVARYPKPNKNTQYIPRSYLSSAYGGYYNFYAASAESAPKTELPDDKMIHDSICPKGWIIPNGSGERSYRNYLTSLYTDFEGTSLASSTNSSMIMRSTPFNFLGGNWYGPNVGLTRADRVNGNYLLRTGLWTDGTTLYHARFIVTSTGIMLSDGSSMTNGIMIRCVLK